MWDWGVEPGVWNELNVWGRCGEGNPSYKKEAFTGASTSARRLPCNGCDSPPPPPLLLNAHCPKPEVTSAPPTPRFPIQVDGADVDTRLDQEAGFVFNAAQRRITFCANSSVWAMKLPDEETFK